MQAGRAALILSVNFVCAGGCWFARDWLYLRSARRLLPKAVSQRGVPGPSA